MARQSLDGVVDAQLDPGGSRYLDLRLDLVREIHHGGGRFEDGEVILTAGGVWDRRKKRYARHADTSRIFRCHAGQMPAATWFASWLEARKRGEHLYELGLPITDIVFFGGRRVGKSNLAFRLVIAYALAFSRSIGWIVLPTYDDGPEADLELDEAMPAKWYRHVQEDHVRYLANGSEIRFRSSDDPESLKKGRADIVVINEAQKHKAETFGFVLPAIADRGGLVIMTANPPKNARGEWVAELIEKARAGQINTKIFPMHAKDNPHVDQPVLQSIRSKLDARTVARELDGELLPDVNRVIYAYSPTWNCCEVGKIPLEGGGFLDVDDDVTEEFTRRKLGVAVANVHGMDFQVTPFPFSAVAKFFRDPRPGASEDEPIVWFVNEASVDQGDEDQLLDALEAKGFSGDDAVVPDATGEWQNQARDKGKASLDVLRRRGWRRIFLPDPESKRNPPVDERLITFNSLFCSSTNYRRAFIDPACIKLARAARLWENKNGYPDKRSDHAHPCDGASYLTYRFFHRKLRKAPPKIELVPRLRRGTPWEERDDE